jgi:hypothetical protein
MKTNVEEQDKIDEVCSEHEPIDFPEVARMRFPDGQDFAGNTLFFSVLKALSNSIGGFDD